jgi:heme-degrading monooxygenase HmoA
MSKYVRSRVLLAITVCSIWIGCQFSSGWMTASAQTPTPGSVARMWHGRVPLAKADEYTAYLNQSGIQKIRSIDGNLGAQMFRRTEKDVAEFYVISYWKSRDAIRAFAGNDIEKTRLLPRDREYLINPELQVKHFDVLIDK